MPSLLTVEQVADTLQVSTRTVRRLAAEGRIDTIRFGYRLTRYRAESVEALISGTTNEIEPGVGAPSSIKTADAGGGPDDEV
jgi:excisionase family DNA binding protein